QSISVGDAATSESSYTNIGAELGYHFYTGNRGANGFFIGPSLIFQNNSVSTTTNVGGTTQSADSSITSYGAALDLGGQHIFRNGFTIGGGVGVMYLAASAAAANESSTVKVEGVLPRFLFTVGYSF